MRALRLFGQLTAYYLIIGLGVLRVQLFPNVRDIFRSAASRN